MQFFVEDLDMTHCGINYMLVVIWFFVNFVFVVVTR